MLSNGIHIGRRGGVRLTGGGGAVDSDAIALIALMDVAPDATRQSHINTLVTSLKSAGVWSLLDELWVMAAHDAQAARLGWKRYKNLTAVNSPTFTTDRGYAGNGTTSYLNTGYTLGTDNVQFTAAVASFGVYSRTDTNVTCADMGVAGGNAQSSISARAVGNFGITVTSSGGTLVTTAVAASTGLFVARRTSASAIQHFRNGVSVGTATNANNATLGRPFYIGANNDYGTTNNFSSREYAAAFVGAAMSEAQQLSLYNAIQAYMTAVGAQV